MFLSNRAYASTLYQEVPMQVLAVTGSASGASIIFHEENAMLLLTEGSNVASKLSAKLQQTPQNQGMLFIYFTSRYQYCILQTRI